MFDGGLQYKCRQVPSRLPFKQLDSVITKDGQLPTSKLFLARTLFHLMYDPLTVNMHFLSS